MTPTGLEHGAIMIGESLYLFVWGLTVEKACRVFGDLLIYCDVVFVIKPIEDLQNCNLWFLRELLGE